MSKLEIPQRVDILISILEQMHPNLYSHISKEEFEKFKTKEIEAYLKMPIKKYIELFAKLLAKFKDGHTKVTFNSARLNAKFKYIDNKVYIINQDKSYDLITNINDEPIENILQRLKQIIPFENKEYLKYNIEKCLSNLNIYNLFGMHQSDNSIKVTTKNNKNVEICLVQNTNKKEKLYDFKVKNKIGILRYSGCGIDPDYSIEELIEDIKKEPDIKDYIIDLRDNQGGRSDIILPVFEYLKSKKINCCALMNEGTFSSGTFAIRDAKEMLNATLIGQNAGQNTWHFGDVEIFDMYDCSFISSTSVFDMRNTFNYEGAIRPDIYVPMTIEDYARGEDKVLKKAMSVLKERDLQK